MNLIGLQRRGFSEESRQNLKKAYKKILLNKKNNLAEAIESFEDSEVAQDPCVKHLIEFIRDSERGIIR